MKWEIVPFEWCVKPFSPTGREIRAHKTSRLLASGGRSPYVGGMASLLLTNGRVLAKSGWSDADVAIDDGKITRISADADTVGSPALDVRGCVIVPGFVDVHVHGAGGFLCEDGEAISVQRIRQTLTRYGVTGFLATIATLEPAALRRAVTAVREATAGATGARILGVHLEGPYLSPLRAGAQAIPWMRAPSIEEVLALQELSGGLIRLITLAPELDGALELIAACREHGIRSSLGHSDATESEMSAGVEAGARHVTHLFNAMRALHHREPGILGVALTDDRVSVELICDGHHLAPRTIDIAMRCKPEGKVVFVSDAVGALGMPEGDYKMFGVDCVIANGCVRLRRGGQLAGSCLGLDQAVRNVRAWLPHLPVERVLRAASAAPLAMLGIDDLGVIEPGMLADLVVLDVDFKPRFTIVGGRVAYRDGVCV